MLLAAVGATAGLVSTAGFGIAGADIVTSLTSATGFAPAAGAASILCLTTAERKASASGLIPAAGLISAADFAGSSLGGIGETARVAAGLISFAGLGTAGAGDVAGSAGLTGLAGEAAPPENFCEAWFFAGSLDRGLAIRF